MCRLGLILNYLLAKAPMIGFPTLCPHIPRSRAHFGRNDGGWCECGLAFHDQSQNWSPGRPFGPPKDGWVPSSEERRRLLRVPAPNMPVYGRCWGQPIFTLKGV